MFLIVREMITLLKGFFIPFDCRGIVEVYEMDVTEIFICGGIIGRIIGNLSGVGSTDILMQGVECADIFSHVVVFFYRLNELAGFPRIRGSASADQKGQ